MEKSFNDALLEILTIIDYQDDKEEFIQELEEQNCAVAMANLIDKLPDDVQDTIKSIQNDRQRLKEEVRKHIDMKAFKKELVVVASDALLNFLHAIWETITSEQKGKIEDLLKSTS